MRLSNLKKLVIYKDALSKGFINCATNLEELYVKSIRQSAVGSVVLCLMKNKNLQRLTLGASPSLIFNEDLSLSSKLDFYLEALDVELFFIVDQTPFFKFLTLQADSLMVHLKYLRIYSAAKAYGFDKFQPHELPEGLDLKINPSIQKLQIERLLLKDLNKLKILLDALPNLQTLHDLDSTFSMV